MADLLVTTAMIRHVNMWRSVCDELPRLTSVLLSVANKTTERIELSYQGPHPSEDREVDY